MNKSKKYLPAIVALSIVVIGVCALVLRENSRMAPEEQVTGSVKQEVLPEESALPPQVVEDQTTGMLHSPEVASSTVSGNDASEAEGSNEADKQRADVAGTEGTGGVPLSGRVLDHDGNPKEGVYVCFPKGMTKTDSDGKFHFDDILSFLGEGKDRGKFNVLVPGFVWYLRKDLDPIPSGSEQSVSLENVKLPDAAVIIEGRVSGDQDIAPRLLYMSSEDGSIVAVIAVRNGVLKQGLYPEGRYTLSNCNFAGRPTPTNAAPQSYQIVLRKGEVTEVDFHVSRKPEAPE